jgi:hypothetical protein
MRMGGCRKTWVRLTCTMHTGLRLYCDPTTGSSTQDPLDAVKRIQFTSTTLVRGIR